MGEGKRPTEMVRHQVAPRVKIFRPLGEEVGKWRGSRGVQQDESVEAHFRRFRG